MSVDLERQVNEKPRIVVFGFPFSPERRSPFSGGGEGPIVIDEILRGVEHDLLVISRMARIYSENERIYPIEQMMMFGETIHSAAALDAQEMSGFSELELIACEMLGRRPAQIYSEAGVGGVGAFELRRKHVRNKIAYWNELIASRRIVGWFNSNAPHFVDDYICYELCRQKGLPTVFPYRMPIVPGVSARLYLPENLFEHGRVHAEDGTIITPADISDSMAMQPLPDDLELIYKEVVLGGRSIADLSRESISSSILGLPVQYLHKVGWVPESKVSILLSLKAWLKKDSARLRAQEEWRRTRMLNKIDYERHASRDIPNEAYVYFPLHMQPEASSCPLGGLYSDQLRAIRLLAESLPKGWLLLVKEHPLQKMEFRPADWYQDIMQSPNVRLVTMDTSSEELQRQSKAVATLTGAAAWEAWLWRKPALVLGHIIYQEAPGIYKVRTRDDAKAALASVAAGQVHTTEDIRGYLGRLAYMTFLGHLDSYIAPCIPEYKLDSEQNERTVGRWMANAMKAKMLSAGVANANTMELGE